MAEPMQEQTSHRMDQSLARREALRIFRLLLIVELMFLGLSLAALMGVGSSGSWGLLLRASPTLLLAILFLPPWLERFLGRYFLALGLGLQVLFSSLEMAYLLAEWPASRLAMWGLPPEVVSQLAAAPPIEPFLFMLIPLVLLAWGYGQRGALLGSTAAAILQLGLGIWALPPEGRPLLFLAQSLARIVLLYLVPLIVSVLAQRERRQHAELEAAHQRLRRHAATVEQLAISRERNRVARDLHDTLAHTQSALIVQLEAMRTLLVHEPDAAPAAVDDLTEQARQGLEESRRAILALRSGPVETMGLTGALRETLQSFQARTGVQSHLAVAGQEPDLTNEEAQALFRIAEEALSNVERHAVARRVDVRLACGSDKIDLMIQDDGTGFDQARVDPAHYGLTGMRERAAIIGASLDIRSGPVGGTEIWCTLQK